jgi:hypothetical protein
MFVRAKRQGEKVYHYLVATERQGSRVRQKTVAYLGKHSTAQAALEALPGEIAQLEREAKECAGKAEATRQRMNPVWLARNNGEVPQPARGGLSTARKLFGHYWRLHKREQTCEQKARFKAAQLEKLHAACSAYNCLTGYHTLGTTQRAETGGLCIKWERHERQRSHHGSKSYLLALLVRSSGGIVCSLARLREEYYNDPKYRQPQEIMFWNDAAASLDALQIDPAERAKIETLITETVRRPSQDEVQKHAEEFKHFLATSRKMWSSTT